jgi:uncharacterized protein
MTGNAPDTTFDERDRTELEAAAFRRLVDHLRERSDVQNIDLMEFGGFCRNCLSRWYREAAEERGLELSEAAARERVYGMPYEAGRIAIRPLGEPSRLRPVRSPP